MKLKTSMYNWNKMNYMQDFRLLPHCRYFLFSSGILCGICDSWLLMFWDNILLPSSGSCNQKINTRKTNNSTPRDWTPCTLQISNISILAEGQHQLVCVHNADKWILSSLKNFPLPETTSRLRWEACYLSMTRDWTLQHQQVHHGPHRKFH